MRLKRTPVGTMLKYTVWTAFEFEADPNSNGLTNKVCQGQSPSNGYQHCCHGYHPSQYWLFWNDPSPLTPLREVDMLAHDLRRNGLTKIWCSTSPSCSFSWIRGTPSWINWFSSTWLSFTGLHSYLYPSLECRPLYGCVANCVARHTNNTFDVVDIRLRWVLSKYDWVTAFCFAVSTNWVRQTGSLDCTRISLLRWNHQPKGLASNGTRWGFETVHIEQRKIVQMQLPGNGHRSQLN